MQDEASPAGEALAQLARGLVEEITALKAAELARQLARDPGTPAPDGPPPDDAAVPAWPAHFRAWHPTLADPDCRTHLLGYPGNRAHVLGWQAERAAGPPPEEGHDPSAARPGRRRRRRW
jgi:hypothetical protein